MINVFLENIFNSLPNTLAILIVLGFSLLALLIALLITILLIRLILRIKWKSQTVKRYIRIRNDGNVNEKFLLRFNIPEDGFKYLCCLEGRKLSKSSLVQKELIVNTVDSFALTRDPSQKSTLASDDSLEIEVQKKQIKEKDETKKKLEESANKAKEKSKKGLGFLRLVSGIFGSLGSLIPGSVGKSFKEKSGELQKTTQTASTKMQMPEQKLRSVEQLKGQVNQVNPKGKPQKEIPAKATQTNNQIITEDVNNVALGTAQIQKEEALYHEVTLSNYYETPSLCPGDHFNVELIMEPIHPYRTEKYSIEVFVRQVKNFGENFTRETSENKSNFNFSIKGLSPIFWILSFLLVLCSVVINSTWTVLFISWLARFVI